MQTMADDYKLNANLSDEREEKLRALVADGPHDGISDTVRALIDDEFDRRDLDADVASDDDSDNEEALYNPFRHDESLTLDRDLLRDVLREYDRPAIHPAHVSASELPKSVAEKTQIVVAVARYRYLTEEGDPEWTPDNVDEVHREVQNVIGDADSRTVSKYRETAFERINDDGGVGRPDNIRPSDVLDIDSVEEWVAETKRDFIDLDDDREYIGVAAIENRREMAAELYKWVASHEGVQECLDELDDAIEAARDAEEDSTEDAEENQSDDGDSGDDTDDEIADQLDALAAAEKGDEEDEDENQPADDRAETEKKREAIKRKGGDPTAKK